MLRHVKKKEKKKKDSPLSKNKEKERDGAYKGVHTQRMCNLDDVRLKTDLNRLLR